jgi:hypothetical protein
MLLISLWAYQMTYEITTQYMPFEFIYGTQPIMLAKFLVLAQRIQDVPKNDIEMAI